MTAETRLWDSVAPGLYVVSGLLVFHPFCHFSFLEVFVLAGCVLWLCCFVCVFVLFACFKTSKICIIICRFIL